MKILILATNHKSSAVRMMAKALKEENIEYDILNPTQLFLMISNHQNGRNQLFDDYKGKTIKKVELNNYDIVIPRIGSEVDFSCEVLKYLEEVFKMKSVQSSEAISNAFSKIRTTILLRAHGLRTPKTMYINKIKNVDIILQHLSKEEKYVIKLDKGSKGRQVSIVSGIAETKSVLDTIGSMSQQLIIQEFIESNETDIRAIVVGGKVIAAYQRKAGKQELRTNISTGGEGIKIKLNEEEQNFCIQCAKAVGLEVAGVDIMKSTEGLYYCIEVNHCPGMNVQKFTPISINKEIVQLAKAMINTSITSKDTKKEYLDFKTAYKHTFDNKEFNKLYNSIKGKVVESRKTGKHTLIQTKEDLQYLLIEQFEIR